VTNAVGFLVLFSILLYPMSCKQQKTISSW